MIWPHAHFELLMPHIFLNPEGMEAHSVDPLHLNHINKFKQVLKACIDR